MTLEEALFWGQQTLLLTLLISGPPVVTALVVGIVVSLIQAVTQVHEMTLVFIPKILCVFAVLWILGDWMLVHMIDFGTLCFESVGEVR